MARHFENWLEGYRRFTEYTESPKACHIWTGIGTVAGALRRQVWFDQGHFKWYPNFYIIIVGPPGVIAKSTTINIGGRLLKGVKGVSLGPDAVTPQMLTKIMAEARIEVPMTQGEGITGTKLIPMSCVTFISAELGSLLDPRDGVMVNVLTDLWDGKEGEWNKMTKTQGSDRVDNPFINILACTTPGWIADNVPRGLIGGGLTSRCIFIYGDTKHQLLPYPGMETPKEVAALSGPLIDDLREIAKLKGAYTLDANAYEWGVKWYNDHWKTEHKHLSKADFDGYLSRKQGHIHKIAMVLAACRRDDLVLTESDLVEATYLLDSAEKHWDRIFSFVGAGDTRRTQERVISVVRRYGKINYETLYRGFYNTTSLYDFENAIKSAKAAGFIKFIQQGADQFIEWRNQGDTPRPEDATTSPQHPEDGQQPDGVDSEE